RPDAVGNWIRDARKWHRASVDPMKVSSFKTLWWRWWVSLQPAERVIDAEAFVLDVPKDDMSWEQVNIAGVNGLLSVVAALTWWGVAVHQVQDGIPRWMDAVVDVTHAL
ncbi:hypothetical protein FA95DRAFT_1478423, partial [Auriscalpium vulgare]